MFYIGIIVYMIPYLCALRQYIAMIKSLDMFQNLEYIDFYINFIKSFHELRNDKHSADITLVTEDDIKVKAHKIILSSSSIKKISTKKFEKVLQRELTDYIIGINWYRQK